MQEDCSSTQKLVENPEHKFKTNPLPTRFRNIRYKKNSQPKKSPVTERRLGGKCFLSDSAQTKIDYFWKPGDVCVTRSLDLEVCQTAELYPNPIFVTKKNNQSNPFESNLKSICTSAPTAAGDSRWITK